MNLKNRNLSFPKAAFINVLLLTSRLRARNRFRIASRPPTSRAAIYRSGVRSPLVGHSHARVPEVESHTASTRSNSIGWEYGGCSRNNTTSIHLQGLPPAASRTTRYDTGCSQADIAYGIWGTRRSGEHGEPWHIPDTTDLLTNPPSESDATRL